MHLMPERVGGRLCLDFVNTVDPRDVGPSKEYLPDYGAVLDWFASADVALPRAISWLADTAQQQPAAAVRAHARLVEMREALFVVISESINTSEVRATDLDTVNLALGESIGHRVLAPSARGGVREEWRVSDSLEQVLWPIAIDAWDLLTEPELLRVRACPVESGGCGWLFLDTSRSGNRRWCDMRTCGNRAKVRAHYSRKAG
ncbi:MAG TPA: ABATE domain-containing protein [Actinomycetes bacterium]|nr:ABATE domain-containing protein [Actinomycetes bacterium]